MQQVDRDAFYKKYNLPEDILDKAHLSWTELCAIYEKHSGNIANLQIAANYVADCLRQLDAVHSLKIRIKDPEHLLEKIIRKKLSDSSRDINSDNYEEGITDLIGIRVLHLFKEDWSRIHDFITDTWNLKELPVANVRKGDSEEFIQRFRDKGCEINEHKYGYRSVHYLVEFQPSKKLFIGELQVRTIFEEGWSEIDHSVRYPYNLDNIILAQLSAILNRLAGSADEIGSYIQFLKEQLENQTQEYQKAIVERDTIELEFKEAIQKLQITEQEKAELEGRLQALSDASKRQSQVEEIFPKLSNYSVIGPATMQYNSIAWTVGDTKKWWEPLSGIGYWPPGISREWTLESLVEAFRIFGYQPCDNAELEPGFEKIAIYADSEGIPTHIAKQLESGAWTSKLGSMELIVHPTLSELEGESAYGRVVQVLKRPVKQ